jgi:hypothetical protein
MGLRVINASQQPPKIGWECNTNTTKGWILVGFGSREDGEPTKCSRPVLRDAASHLEASTLGAK